MIQLHHPQEHATMYGNIRKLNTAEQGLVRAASFAVGRHTFTDEQAPRGQFATTPNGKARNVTAGVQDWSVGPLYPCTVAMVGDHGCTQYQAADLHDEGFTFERRDTYAEAEADARFHLAHLAKYGRVKAAQLRNLSECKGGVRWDAVAA